VFKVAIYVASQMGIQTAAIDSRRTLSFRLDQLECPQEYQADCQQGDGNFVPSTQASDDFAFRLYKAQANAHPA
jgi:hypothetical protein